MYLFIDTETTGTSVSKDRSVQIAWILTDANGLELDRSNQIIYPEGFTIPAGAERIHGIDTAKAREVGVPLRDALQKLKKVLKVTEVIVCHNVQFDLAILENDAAAVGVNLGLAELRRICTMRATTQWCRIPHFNGRSGFKWPRLEELHRRCFGSSFDNAHDALSDVLATKKCFFYLLEKKVIELPEGGSRMASRPRPTQPNAGAFGSRSDATKPLRSKQALPATGTRPPKVAAKYRVESIGRKANPKGDVPPTHAKESASQGDKTAGNEGVRTIQREYKTERVGRMRQSPSFDHRRADGSFTRTQVGKFDCLSCRKPFSVTLNAYETQAHCPVCQKICSVQVNW